MSFQNNFVWEIFESLGPSCAEIFTSEKVRSLKRKTLFTFFFSEMLLFNMADNIACHIMERPRENLTPADIGKRLWPASRGLGSLLSELVNLRKNSWENSIKWKTSSTKIWTHLLKFNLKWITKRLLLKFHFPLG